MRFLLMFPHTCDPAPCQPALCPGSRSQWATGHASRWRTALHAGWAGSPPSQVAADPIILHTCSYNIPPLTLPVAFSSSEPPVLVLTGACSELPRNGNAEKMGQMRIVCLHYGIMSRHACGDVLAL